MRMMSGRDFYKPKKLKNDKRFDMFWGTEAELNYIDNIGSYATRKPNSRLQMLINYWKANMEKKEWGKINPEVVKKYVMQAIIKEGGKI